MADKKGNIFQRIAKGFGDVIAELKRVTWPTKEKLTKTSAVVLLVIVFFAVYLTIIGSGGRWVLDKIGFYNIVETTAARLQFQRQRLQLRRPLLLPRLLLHRQSPAQAKGPEIFRSYINAG